MNNTTFCKFIKSFPAKNFINLFFINLFFTYSAFADLTWQLPAQDVYIPSVFDFNDKTQITTDASGQYVHIVWEFEPTGPNQILTTSSSDFGRIWDPALILSSAAGDSSFAKIVTDQTGKYVYTAFQFNPGGGFRIEFARSTDFGQTWTPVASQTTLSSILGTNASIATDLTGQYVYVSWHNNVQVEFSRSTDFGATWPAPASVTVLSDTTVAGDNLVVTSDDGRYVHSIWMGRKGGAVIRVQAASSSDFGATWTSFSNIPNLSANDFNATDLDLATSSSGQYVYATWIKSIGGSTIVQFSRSIDFGATWTSSPGINLSQLGINSFKPQIATDKSGKYVFVIWDRSGVEAIQVIRSTNFGATFEMPVTILTPSPTTPEIAIDNLGRYVYTVWNDFVGGDFVINSSLSFDFGKSFNDPQTISRDDSFGRPSIATSANGIYGYSGFDRETATNNLLEVTKGIDIPRTNKRFNFVDP